MPSACELASNLYIKVLHHPHSGKSSATVIPLDRPIPTTQLNQSPFTACKSDCKPWAPFRNCANFEFAEEAVTQGFHAETVDKLLAGYHGHWASHTNLMLHTNKDLQKYCAAACKFVVQFQDGEVTHEYQGKEHTFRFKFRDPWEWLHDILTDSTLSESIMWYPVEKYLHNGPKITRIFDELNSGTEWWDIQVRRFASRNSLPHCFLPLDLWIDKSNVSKTVTKHPIILHLGFLPSLIRNGSGNGGRVLVSYMPVICAPVFFYDDFYSC
ncbi:hypothetical protein K439DRAFT_1351404 [Ramaria rubella]|nr:hypothetical protein K439DRAFT_1351404 [Ramaria rubella]